MRKTIYEMCVARLLQRQPRTEARARESGTRGFDPQSHQIPRRDFHLGSKRFQLFFIEVAAAHFDGDVMAPAYRGRAIFTGRSKQADDPALAVIGGLAFVDEYVGWFNSQR